VKEGETMKKQWLAVAIMLVGMPFSAGRAAAQGPAGAGATVAAESPHSSHSLNPIKWVKKDSKTSSEQLNANSDQDKKLTAKLQGEGVLPAKADVKDTCATFKGLSDCVAALHASHNLGLDFNCLRFDLTSVQIDADMSSCKNSGGDKGISLMKAIRLLKPSADAKAEAKTAEKQAKDDLKDLGS
jgi:hypothetical protein